MVRLRFFVEASVDTVVRCHMFQRAPGRVPFYIARSDRLTSNEVGELEYRVKPLGIGFHMIVKSVSEDERDEYLAQFMNICS